MANVRDSDTSLWLHNKLGTSNDSWISGSICSQLNKEVLRNIKDCFPDLQTQVKLKLLLSFFHIPRRLVEEWKTELDEIIEVAGLDTELWVSMIAETMKTFPATGQLNTEISDYEETRPIFTDMVTDLKKMVSRHCDIGMLPLECHYLNKNALTSVVGQQLNPVKHFTIKRKPKSANLRLELLQKSADAQSSLKKTSAPTIPLRSRGMPRKMTDTTPLKGIPSRVPSSGFRSPTANQNSTRPNLVRTPAGRKDGGIKLIEFTEQPLGYAAAKKRKRQQELEEQQRKSLELKQSAPSSVIAENPPASNVNATPDYAAGLSASSVYNQPPTPAPVIIKEEENDNLNPVSGAAKSTTTVPNSLSQAVTRPNLVNSSVVKIEEIPIKLDDDNLAEMTESVAESTLPLKSIGLSNLSSQVNGSTLSTPALGQYPSDSVSVTATSSPQKRFITSTSTPIQLGAIRNIPITTTAKSSSGPIILSQTIIQPPKIKVDSPTHLKVSSHSVLDSSSAMKTITCQRSSPQIILTSSNTSVPSLTSLSQTRPIQAVVQSQGTSMSINPSPQKIISKPTQAIPIVVGNTSRSTSVQSDPPPLIATQQAPLLNVSLPNRPVTIQPASQAAQVQHIQAQLQQQQLQQIQTHTVVSNSNATQPPKFAQVVMSPSMNVKGKTIILAQKGVILRSVSGDLYQQIPIGSVSGLGNLNGATLVATGSQNLLKNTPQNSSPNLVKPNQQLPALIPTSNIAQNVNMPVVIASHNMQQQQQQQPQTVQTILNPQQQTIMRPVLTTNLQSGLAALPQGLTLIQRAGLQPQLVQVQNTQQTLQQQQQQQPALHRTLITQPQTQPQIRSQRIIIQQDRQATIPHQQQQQHQLQELHTTQQQQQLQVTSQPQQQPQRRGLSLSNEHVIKAHEMFRKANRVNRPDKALILGFMAGLRENPRPNPENVIVIKLGETEEHVKQEDNTSALMLVESLIRLDYNTGEWKTFQNYRRLDQSSQQSNQDSSLSQTQNPVVI